MVLIYKMSHINYYFNTKISIFMDYYNDTNLHVFIIIISVVIYSFSFANFAFIIKI